MLQSAQEQACNSLDHAPTYKTDRATGFSYHRPELRATSSAHKGPSVKQPATKNEPRSVLLKKGDGTTIAPMKDLGTSIGVATCLSSSLGRADVTRRAQNERPLRGVAPRLRCGIFGRTRAAARRSSASLKASRAREGFPLSRPWPRSLRRRIAPNRACLSRSEWLARFEAFLLSGATGTSQDHLTIPNHRPVPRTIFRLSMTWRRKPSAILARPLSAA
jgi:hypothetical protein